MAQFQYDAVDKAGRQKSAVIEAASVDEAREKLRSKGLFPTNISKKGKKKKAKKGAGDERKRTASLTKGINGGELTNFTRQFATLVDSGLPIVRAMDIIEQMLKPGNLRNAVMDVKDEVEAGASLSEAMAKSGKAFDELYVSMIRAGEMSGLLGRILNRLAEFREKSDRLKKQIIGALIYPIAVLTVAGGILSLIMVYIVPKFKKMFDEMNVEMPAMTKILMQLADVMLAYWYLLPGIPIGIAGAFYGIRKTKQGKYATDMGALSIPVFGVIIKKSTISRFCRTLGELTSAGVPILDALGIIKTAVGNTVVAEAIGDIHASIREGENIAEPMKRAGIFDAMVVNMVQVGEETGELDGMLIKIADTYDNDVDTMVSSMMSLLEPFMIIGMGLAVGFIVIALFMPLISIIDNMG